MRRAEVPEPVLITSAPEASDASFDRRRRKYAIMMTMRAICVLAAALTYRVSIYLALAFVVGGMVLPWCAVIIANDRPPKKRAPRPANQPVMGVERALMPGENDRVVDG